MQESRRRRLKRGEYNINLTMTRDPPDARLDAPTGCTARSVSRALSQLNEWSWNQHGGNEISIANVSLVSESKQMTLTW